MGQVIDGLYSYIESMSCCCSDIEIDERKAFSQI